LGLASPFIKQRKPGILPWFSMEFSPQEKTTDTQQEAKQDKPEGWFPGAFCRYSQNEQNAARTED
jgi:hypothetical protein